MGDVIDAVKTRWFEACSVVSNDPDAIAKQARLARHDIPLLLDEYEQLRKRFEQQSFAQILQLRQTGGSVEISKAEIDAEAKKANAAKFHKTSTGIKIDDLGDRLRFSVSVVNQDPEEQPKAVVKPVAVDVPFIPPENQ